MRAGSEARLPSRRGAQARGWSLAVEGPCRISTPVIHRFATQSAGHSQGHASVWGGEGASLPFVHSSSFKRKLLQGQGPWLAGGPLHSHGPAHSACMHTTGHTCCPTLRGHRPRDRGKWVASSLRCSRVRPRNPPASFLSTLHHHYSVWFSPGSPRLAPSCSGVTDTGGSCRLLPQHSALAVGKVGGGCPSLARTGGGEIRKITWTRNKPKRKEWAFTIAHWSDSIGTEGIAHSKKKKKASKRVWNGTDV